MMGFVVIGDGTQAGTEFVLAAHRVIDECVHPDPGKCAVFLRDKSSRLPLALSLWQPCKRLPRDSSTTFQLDEGKSRIGINNFDGPIVAAHKESAPLGVQRKARGLVSRLH